MLLKPIKSESYGVLRYKPFRPSLRSLNLKPADFQRVSLFSKNLLPLSAPLVNLRIIKMIIIVMP